MLRHLFKNRQNRRLTMAARSTFASSRDERRWNMMSEKMAAFHEWFKEECTPAKLYFIPDLTPKTVNTLYELADGSFERRGMSLPRYLQTARQLNQHLTMHHTIEERHIFPLLGKKMPQFAKGHDEEGAHLQSHKGIHEGLAKLQKLVTKWSSDPSTYSPTEMRDCLDSFREVLFHHLDEEVSDLAGDNLKKYFTLDELDAIPM